MLALRIALRYLLSPKSHSAINAITLVAAVGVAIITAAMIGVLSVYNGFEDLVRSLTARIDPGLRIEAAEGRCFADSDTLRALLLAHPDVTELAPMLEEQVLLAYGSQQVPAMARGVDSLYRRATDLEACVGEMGREAVGQWHAADGGADSLTLRSGAMQTCVMGVGLAATLGVGVGAVRPVAVYMPRREVQWRIAAPDEAFRRADLFVVDYLCVAQADYDDRIVLLPLAVVQQMEPAPRQLTSYELRLRPGADAQRVARQVARRLEAHPAACGRLAVHTALDLQADAYRIMHVEKWITYLMILMILMIASFNVIGALSMLIIDKEAQTATLTSLGASRRMVRRIFTCEGWLITSAGAAVGTVVGCALVAAQQHFGLITLGDEARYVVSAYPVSLLWSDVGLTLATVVALGGLATAYTVRQTL